MQAYLIGALVSIVLMVMFIFQNQQQVMISFLTFTSPKISVGLVILLAAVLGSLIVFMIDGFRHLRTVKELKEEKVKAKRLQHELDKAKPPVNPPGDSQ